MMIAFFLSNSTVIDNLTSDIRITSKTAGTLTSNFSSGDRIKYFHIGPDIFGLDNHSAFFESFNRTELLVSSNKAVSHSQTLF